MDLYQFAMKMEVDGKAFYEKMAAETPHRGLKSVFSMLAADEQKHYDTIVAMREGGAVTMADTTVLENTRNVFEGIRAEKTLAEGLRKEHDAFQYAMKIEADSVRLYEDMAKKENDAAIIALLQKIADEEKKHYNIVENLYDYTLRPEYFLEWREFSNLKPL
ncbi:ferritin-like domain protein [Geotalea daltonii FRC-32]|uniref:Ferritin-like domain protein n=1 Tax=Geotalea daltonii (strain DSM 22248 / JCM 15807 / FRC-32) TaxID=316067 RepID=B9M866_GEODF|nr:ferritin family protein [Geotalea daltonii]ACM20332.1 ferritin-like domain protein [Geotalea daltonii FRC-32]